MEDRRIIEGFKARDEDALTVARERYGEYLNKLAMRILNDREDAEECVNDALYKAWQNIPPEEPLYLGAWLGKVTRRLAIDRLKARDAAKRGGKERPLPWDDLPETETALRTVGPEEAVLAEGLKTAVAAFVRGLPAEQKDVFLRRFWYLDSVAEIAERHGCSEGRITMMLRRMKEKLRKQLKEEGWIE